MLYFPRKLQAVLTKKLLVCWQQTVYKCFLLQVWKDGWHTLSSQMHVIIDLNSQREFETRNWKHWIISCLRVNKHSAALHSETCSAYIYLITSQLWNVITAISHIVISVLFWWIGQPCTGLHRICESCLVNWFKFKLIGYLDPVRWFRKV